MILSDTHALRLPIGRHRDRRSNLLDRRYRPFFGNNATTSNCCGSSWNKTPAAVSLLPGLLRHGGRMEFAHNNAAIEIPAASIGSAFTFLFCDAGSCRTSRDQRHGLVRLSPCFSPALAPVSAESRHEAKQFFMLRGTVIGNSGEKKKKPLAARQLRIITLTINHGQCDRGTEIRGRMVS
jgi:hypothetical protein